jgi:hypothetical protein
MDLMSILKQAGFKGEGLRMAYAIAMAESGGNARAHNGNRNTGDNSYGLFQINMLGGMGPERRARYGLSSNDALFDPLTNARVAYKMSNGGKNWGPWSTYGNGAYRKYYGGSSATVKNSGGGSSGGGGGSAGVAKTRSETAEAYGFVESLFNSVPELKKLFDKAVKGGWTADKFQAALRDTKWWKTKPESARKFLITQYGDPATAKQQLAQQRVKIKQMAAALGITVDSKLSKKLDDWTMKSLMNGWTDGQMRDELGKFVTFGDDHWGGEGGEAIEKMKTYAYQMGVTFNGKWFADRARLVVRGMKTQQDVEDEIRRASKTVFSQWSKQIDAGQTVADIASPYMQSMAQILELPAGSINLFDPTIKKALQAKDKTTGANMVKPIWQFENELRSDSRWKSTQNAQNSMMQIAHQVLADFGVKA